MEGEGRGWAVGGVMRVVGGGGEEFAGCDELMSGGSFGCHLRPGSFLLHPAPSPNPTSHPPHSVPSFSTTPTIQTVCPHPGIDATASQLDGGLAG